MCDIGEQTRFSMCVCVISFACSITLGCILQLPITLLITESKRETHSKSVTLYLIERRFRVRLILIIAQRCLLYYLAAHASERLSLSLTHHSHFCISYYNNSWCLWFIFLCLKFHRLALLFRLILYSTVYYIARFHFTRYYIIVRLRVVIYDVAMCFCTHSCHAI